MEESNNYEYEHGYPMGQITQQQAKQLLAKRFWTYEKIGDWVESLPQMKELRRQENTQKKLKEEK